MAVKTYQYRLTEVECQLHNLLRRLEAEFEDEYPKIFNGADIPKLDRSLTLSVRLGGRELENFDLRGKQLIQDCATVGAKIIRKLLTSDEDDFNCSDSPSSDNAALPSDNEASDKAMPWLTKSSCPTSTASEVTSWETIQQTVIPSYVKSVSFTVAHDDLDMGRQMELETHFPNVNICTNPLCVDEAQYLTDTIECECQVVADQFLQQLPAMRTAQVVSSMTTTARLPSLDTSVQTVAETVPVAPMTSVILEPSFQSCVTVGGPEFRIKGVAAEATDDTETPSGLKKMHSDLPILRIAERIGLEVLQPQDKVIHAMWLHWRKKHEVKPYASGRLTLEQHYNNLVVLYILAYHKREFDLCFAVLVRFQNTNYWSTNILPEEITAALAFQYLPEDDDLCRWIAVLFAFLWSTQVFESYQHLLSKYENLDRDALSKLLFAVARIRCPLTMGSDAAVLDRWCEVHHHEEGRR
ncbi:hypothetical protein EJ07DRAFT_156700 [Lizonia empirigonia]|nr:hypothetical protein EJ07DRAFT_156700 [Lizonia empirigonia]